MSFSILDAFTEKQNSSQSSIYFKTFKGMIREDENHRNEKVTLWQSEFFQTKMAFYWIGGGFGFQKVDMYSYIQISDYECEPFKSNKRLYTLLIFPLSRHLESWVSKFAYRHQFRTPSVINSKFINFKTLKSQSTEESYSTPRVNET